MGNPWGNPWVPHGFPMVKFMVKLIHGEFMGIYRYLAFIW
jgi:hypothetical protein